MNSYIKAGLVALVAVAIATRVPMISAVVFGK